MIRQPSEPATTWRGAYHRATAWAGPLIGGSYVAGKLVPDAWLERVLYGLMIGAAPVLLGAIYRSWRVALAAMTIVAGLLAAVYLVVFVFIKSYIHS